jgi:hypothetical protein
VLPPLEPTWCCSSTVIVDVVVNVVVNEEFVETEEVEGEIVFVPYAMTVLFVTSYNLHL